MFSSLVAETENYYKQMDFLFRPSFIGGQEQYWNAGLISLRDEYHCVPVFLGEN